METWSTMSNTSYFYYAQKFGCYYLYREIISAFFLSMTITWSCRYGRSYTIDELTPNGWDCDTCMCACYLPTDDDEWVEEFLDSYD